MEITTDQKALLQLVDADIEASFVGGVTQAGAYLPALPLYDRIKPADRQTGRQGILSTFAGFLARLASFAPTAIPLPYLNGFSSYNQYIAGFGNPTPYAEPAYYKNAIGEVVLEGLIATPTCAAYVSFGNLPVGYRSAKTRIYTGIKDGSFIAIIVDSSGDIYCAVTCTSGQWISLDGIRFRPA